LKDKRSVIFGAGGSIGAAVARAFAAEGAELFLAGRSKSSLEAVAGEITDSGGRAHVAVVDVLDHASVDGYLEEVVEQAGGIDVEFNATGPRAADYGTGTPALDLPVEQFLVGQSVLTGQFITARCAARRMVA
jgi:NADP-dependent 3-hydroxy acid dehydrogenase YdfG